MPTEAEPDADRPLSERIERSAWGQLLISGGIVLLLAATLGTHLPSSAIAGTVGERSNEIVRLLGSEQAWGVFAPNPRSSTLALEGHVTFADGSEAVWELPSGSRVFGNLRYYRWRKWVERVRADDYANTWEPTARWIATQFDDRDSPVVRVDLVRYFRENSILDPQPPFESYTYYSLDLAAEASR